MVSVDSDCRVLDGRLSAQFLGGGIRLMGSQETPGQEARGITWKKVERMSYRSGGSNKNLRFDLLVSTACTVCVLA